LAADLSIEKVSLQPLTTGIMEVDIGQDVGRIFYTPPSQFTSINPRANHT
jgi:hypothetical protein